jgi:hypothetical protein
MNYRRVNDNTIHMHEQTVFPIFSLSFQQIAIIYVERWVDRAV